MILISIDSLRSDHLSSYGYYRNTSPSIDRIANDGILFKNYITQAFFTFVTEMSVHTGKYPSTSNFVGRGYTLDNSTLLLSQILKDNGYNTAAFISSPEFGSWFPAFNKSFDVYDYSEIVYRGLPRETLFYWLDDNKNEKFFLWLPVGGVHPPFGQTEENLSLSEYDPPNYNGVFRNVPLYTLDVLRRIYNHTYYPENGTEIQLSQDDIDYIIGRYDVGIINVDQFLGRLFTKLDELGLVNKTIIIISSEHGEAFTEHDYVGHYDIYDTEIHTPLIMKFPNLKSKKIDTQIQSIDILPTILDSLAINISTQVDGKSVIPLIAGKEKRDFNKYVFVERIPLWEVLLQELDISLFKDMDVIIGLNKTDEDFAIRTNEWKLIYRESRGTLENISWYKNLTGNEVKIPMFELYNLKDDPHEKNNLIDKEPKVAAELKGKLVEWINSLNKTKK